jgi:hypothetical protein
VVAHCHTPAGRETWYIQCKRYEKIAFATLRDELDKLAKHSKDNADFAPEVIVFATACPVPPQARDEPAAHARALGLPQPYYWGRLELDERLKAQPETEAEFFGAPSPSARIDLRGARVGGGVTLSGGSTFVGGKAVVAGDDEDSN